MSWKGRNLLTIRDLSAADVAELVDKAVDIKTNPGKYRKSLDGMTLAMIFEKPSLRTRVTFETGMTQLHGHAIYISPSDAGLGKRESVADIARNLERWVDGIMARVFAHSVLTEMAEHAGVPVINGLSDHVHPVQGLSDLLTIKEHAGTFTDKKLAYLGDGNNVAHSLLAAGARTGLSVSIITPEGYEPDESVVSWAREAARETGSTIEVCNEVDRGVDGAHFLYTDVWASMGQESEADSRRKVFEPLQVNERVMKLAAEGVKFMHCLPAHRGEEVTNEVADSEASIIFDQAENRLHMQKAVMVLTMGDQ